MAKYFCNLGAYYIIEITTVLYNTNIVSKDQERNIFYINNYIKYNQFNQLYMLN